MLVLREVWTIQEPAVLRRAGFTAGSWTPRGEKPPARPPNDADCGTEERNPEKEQEKAAILGEKTVGVIWIPRV